MSAAWVQRCPEGHANLESRTQGYACETCGVVYPGDPYDARQTEFPVGDDTDTGRPLGLTKWGVLADLVQTVAGDARTAAKAKELDGAASAVGQRLSVLADEGLVERVERSAADWWRPTDKGQRLAGSPLNRDDAGRFVPAEVTAGD